MLNICEIFTSIQGESTKAGLPCTFVRLSGCNLRCVWCDTRYSYEDSGISQATADEVVREVDRHHAGLVEITGGEPLLQPEVVTLCEKLLDSGYSVMVETNGTQDVSVIPENVIRVIDVKCPGSGSGDSFLLDNLKHLRNTDELKFVLASLDDAEWAKRFCVNYSEIGESGCALIFSPVTSRLSYETLADWMAENEIDGVRLGIQLHKIIWGNARSK